MSQQIIVKQDSCIGVIFGCTEESFGISCPQNCGKKLGDAPIGTEFSVSDCPLVFKIFHRLTALNYPTLFSQNPDEFYIGRKDHNGDILFDFCDPCEKCLHNDWCQTKDYKNHECPKLAEFQLKKLLEKQF